MVRAPEEEEEEEENLKSRLYHFQGMREDGGRQSHSMDLDSNNGSMSPLDDDRLIRSHSSGPLNDRHLEKQQIGSALNRLDKIKSRLGRDGSSINTLSKDERGKSTSFSPCISFLFLFFFLLSFAHHVHRDLL